MRTELVTDPCRKAFQLDWMFRSTHNKIFIDFDFDMRDDDQYVDDACEFAWRDWKRAWRAALEPK